jgi:WD40 repeat protein
MPAPDRLRRLGTETGAKDHPWKVAFLPGRDTVAALCCNGRLRLVPLGGGKEKSVAIGGSGLGAHTHLAASPTGAFVLAGRFCIDPATGKKLWSGGASEPWVPARTMVVAADGRTAYAGTYRLDATTGEYSGTLIDPRGGHVGTVTTSALSISGELLATGDSSGIVVLTDLRSPVDPAAPAAVGRTRAGGCEDKNSATRGFFSRIDALAFGRQWLAVGGAAGEVRLLSTQDLALARSLPTGGYTLALAFLRDGATLVAATHSPGGPTNLVVWNAETGQERLRIRDLGPCHHLSPSDSAETVALALSTGVFLCDVSGIESLPPNDRAGDDMRDALDGVV